MTIMTKQSSKRQFLQLLTGSIVTLAGCNSFNDDSPSPEKTATTETERTSTSSVPSTTRSRRTTRQNETTTPPTTTETPAQPTTTETQLASMEPPRFSLTFEQEGVMRDFLKVSKLVLRGGTGHKVQTYDVGTNVTDISFVRGASDPGQSDDRTWRSFDSPTTIALTYASNLEHFSGFEIECQPRTVEAPLRIMSHGDIRSTVTVTSGEWQTLYFALQ